MLYLVICSRNSFFPIYIVSALLLAAFHLDLVWAGFEFRKLLVLAVDVLSESRARNFAGRRHFDFRQCGLEDARPWRQLG